MKKYFIGYMDNSEDNITASHSNLPKLNRIFKEFWKSEICIIPTWRKAEIYLRTIMRYEIK